MGEPSGSTPKWEILGAIRQVSEPKHKERTRKQSPSTASASGPASRFLPWVPTLTSLPNGLFLGLGVLCFVFAFCLLFVLFCFVYTGTNLQHSMDEDHCLKWVLGSCIKGLSLLGQHHENSKIKKTGPQSPWVHSVKIKTTPDRKYSRKIMHLYGLLSE